MTAPGTPSDYHVHQYVPGQGRVDFDYQFTIADADGENLDQSWSITRVGNPPFPPSFKGECALVVEHEPGGAYYVTLEGYYDPTSPGRDNYVTVRLADTGLNDPTVDAQFAGTDLQSYAMATAGDGTFVTWHIIFTGQ